MNYTDSVIINDGIVFERSLDATKTNLMNEKDNVQERKEEDNFTYSADIVSNPVRIV
jgi:hypothetical protein